MRKKHHKRPPSPACPSCRTRNGTPANAEASIWKCGRCGGFYDDDSDEGGDYGKNPSTRLERAERRRESRVGR